MEIYNIIVDIGNYQGYIENCEYGIDGMDDEDAERFEYTEWELEELIEEKLETLWTLVPEGGIFNHKGKTFLRIGDGFILPDGTRADDVRDFCYRFEYNYNNN